MLAPRQVDNPSARPKRTHAATALHGPSAADRLLTPRIQAGVAPDRTSPTCHPLNPAARHAHNPSACPKPTHAAKALYSPSATDRPLTPRTQAVFTPDRTPPTHRSATPMFRDAHNPSAGPKRTHAAKALYSPSATDRPLNPRTQAVFTPDRTPPTHRSATPTFRDAHNPSARPKRTHVTPDRTPPTHRPLNPAHPQVHNATALHRPTRRPHTLPAKGGA